MKKWTMRIKSLLCYILILSIVATGVQPAGTVKAASNVGLNKKSVKILVGETFKLEMSGDTIKKATSKNNKIATVTNDGTVTSKKQGKTTITVTASNGKLFKCKVKVITGLTKKKAYVTKGGSLKVKLCGTAIKTIKTKNKKVAKVSKKGKYEFVIKGKKKGSTKIKVRGKNNKTYTCYVKVETPDLNKKDIVLTKWDNITLKLNNSKQTVMWSSNAAGVVTVSEKGVLTPVAAGEAVISAIDESKKVYTCHVKIEEPKMAASELHMDVNQEITLVLAGNTQKVTWTTSNKLIASVNNNGKVKAISSGTAIITATVESGASFKCKIIAADKQNKYEKPTKINTDETEKTTASDGGEETGNHENDGDEIGDGDPEQGGDSKPEIQEEEYYVNFLDVEGGIDMKPMLVPKGTTIGSIPTPKYADNRTFIAWYYDAEYTNPANAEDIIDKTTTLYAKSVKMEIATPEEVVTVTAVNDAEPDFHIGIRSTDPTMTAQQVLDSIEVVNIIHKGSDEYQLKENNVSIEGENGVYTLSGKHILMEETVDNFEKGGSYVIKLPEVIDGNDYLMFDNQPKSVREYDVNIAQKEVNNMELNNDVIMIEVSELDGLFDENGTKQDYIDGSFYTIDEHGNTKESEEISGYFVWKDTEAEKLQVGNTIALYSGMNPAKAMENPEKFDEGDNHIAYLFINKIDGNRFYYGNADMANIIKMPEILPIPSDADLKLDDLPETLEIMASELDWSDDKYSDVKLDSTTKLEEDDFIVLYKGEYGSTDMEQVGDYLKVTKVASGGTTLNPVGDECEFIRITTEKVNVEEISESGDTNYSRPIDAMDNLTPEQKEEIKQQAVADAQNSGFLEEAGQYLAQTAMATEGFTSLARMKDIDSLQDFKFKVKSSPAPIIGTANEFYDKYKDYSDKYKEMMETYKQFLDDDDDDDDDGAVEVELENLDVELVEAENLPGGLGIHMNVQFSVEVTVPKFEKELGGDEDNKDKDDKDKDDKDDKDGKDKDDKDGKDDKDDKDGKDDKDDKDDKDGEDEEPEEENKLNIEIEADFLQEIQLSMGFNAKIEWKKILCIPYPADVVFSPSFTTGTYTGINVEATAMTAGQDDGMGDSILEDHNTMIKDISDELKSLMEEDEAEEDEEAEEVSNWLSVKYKQMLEQEHDAITLVEISLFKTKYELFPGIVEFGLEVKFIVTVDVVVTIGLEFSNIQCKKTIYNIHVLKGKCDSETVEIIPAELDFKFYVMGTLELKVGFEIELSLELVEGILGSASLTVGVGAYVDLYGFFYYHVHILNGKKTENSAGALYVQIGIYIEVGTGAQIGKNFKKIKGKIASFEHTLFETQIPLKEFGESEVPLNFEILQEDIDDIELHQYVKQFVIPDEYYEITTMDMEEGEIGSTTYDDECYGVELSNSWFKYDPDTHTVELKDGYKEMEAECTATLYYKNGHIPLSYAKMKRTIEISWDNYLDGYAISPFTEGGSYVEATVGAYGAEVVQPKNPTRKGYVFDGWYKRTEDGNGNYTEEPYEYPETMPAESVRIYAHWKPADDTPYTIKYYLEDPNTAGEYSYDGKKIYRGTTLTNVEPEILQPGAYKKNLTEEEIANYNKYEYTGPTNQKLQILADGTASLNIYYDVKRSKSTFTSGGKGTAPDITLTEKYGENIYAPEISANGYELTGWLDKNTNQVIDGDTILADSGKIGVADGTDTVYEAQWAPRTDILYRVEYYVQQLSGAYTVQTIDYGKGAAGDKISEDTVRNLIVTAKFLQEDGTEIEQKGKAEHLFTLSDGGGAVQFFDKMTVGGQPVDEGEIKADGSTVIKVIYSRKQYTVTLKGADANDNSIVYSDYKVCAGGKMALPVPVKEGYTFLGYKDQYGNNVPLNEKTGFEVVTVNGDATYTARGWKPNNYTVMYDANNGTMAGATSQNFTYDEAQNLYDAPTRTDYVFKGWKDTVTNKIYAAGESVKNLTSKENGVIELTAVWELKSYDVNYNLNGGSISEGANPNKYVPNAPETALDYPEREGYNFIGWYLGENRVFSLPGGNLGALTLDAKWAERDDIPYVVRHYQKDLDGEGETLVLSENLTGTAGKTVSPEVKSFEGFTAPARKNVEIATDGSTIIDYVYTRKTHTLTLDLDGGTFTGSGTPLTTQVAYGENLVLDIPVKNGKVFAGWTKNGTVYTQSTMPDADLNLTARWSNAEAAVVVNHYKQDIEGNYTILADTEVITGQNGDTVTPEIRSYEGFNAPSATEVTLTAGEIETVEIKYARERYKLSWNLDGGEAKNTYTSGDVYFGQPIIAPIVKKQNYSYIWDKEPASVMGMEALTYTAVWVANKYKVAFDGNGGNVEGDVEKSVTYGKAYGTLPIATKDNAEFTGWYDAKTNGNKIDENTLVGIGKNHILYAGWNYVTATITYQGIENTDVNDNPISYNVGEETIIREPVREGYIFLGWSVGDSEERFKEYIISADSTTDLTLVAHWEIRTHTLSLYTRTGLYLVKKLEAGADLSGITLPKISGFTLTGWTVVQTEEFIDKLPSTMPENDLTLVAQWQENVYRAVFNNMYEAKVDEVTWKITDNSFIIQPPSEGRRGYDFAGWYTKANYDSDSLVERMNPVAYNVNLYAKWIPRTYKINLYYEQGMDSTGKEFNEDEDNVFTFDETRSLKTASSLGLKRNGYTFMGWSTKSGGNVEYSDGYTFTQGGHSLYNGENVVSLFAVWSPITYQITYDSVTVGSSGNPAVNPTQYSIESTDVTLEVPQGIKEGYEFLGWYDITSGNEVLIEGNYLKLKGEVGNKKLKAKWAYAGTFSIALKSSTSSSPTGDGETTYTITRTLATGINLISSDQQRVYFRTVNGTAIGGTVTVKGNAGPEKDKESANNFLHVGGNNTFAMFDGNNTPYVMVKNKKQNGTINADGSIAQVEFKVTKEKAAIRYYGHQIPGATNGTFAHQFNLTGYNTRYYTVELYRIESVKGNVTGVYGTKEVTRTMNMPSGNILTVNKLYGNKSTTVDHSAHFDNDSNGNNAVGPVNFGGMLGTELSYYLQQAGATANLKIRVYADSDEDSTTWSNDYYLKYRIGNTWISRWGGRWIDEDDGYQWCDVGSSGISWSDFATGVAYYYGETEDDGLGGTDYWTKKHEFTLSVSDTAKASQVGIAPAATTDYQKGDKVTFSVIYAELISSASNVTVDASKFEAQMPLTNVTWTGKGVGTNVLVFEGIASENFANTTWESTGTNDILMDVKPVNGGTVKDVKGN